MATLLTYDYFTVLFVGAKAVLFYVEWVLFLTTHIFTFEPSIAQSETTLERKNLFPNDRIYSPRSIFFR